MAFIDKEALEYKLFLEETSKNKVLAINVKKYTTKNNLNYNDYWEKVIYPIDRMRVETNEFNLFDYILNNVEIISKEGHLDKSILDTLSNMNLKTNIPNIKFKLVSTNGVDNIKKIINLALENSNTKDILDVMVETPPNYYITSTKTMDVSYHNKFLNSLESLSKNQENNIHMTH
jgi:translation initiation factor 2 alpha subunit (eIF-2alpha)